MRAHSSEVTAARAQPQGHSHEGIATKHSHEGTARGHIHEDRTIRAQLRGHSHE